ncbi:MAG: hypothetical protein WC346_10950 [Methanogenium sp.]|jgi:hypothetical protein
MKRNYSAKDVTRLRKLMGGTKKVSGDKAREILDKYEHINDAIINLKDLIDKVKKNREEHINSLGNKKKNIKAKVGSRRYRKLLKAKRINKEGYEVSFDYKKYSRDRQAIRLRMAEEHTIVKLPLGTKNKLTNEVS